VRFVDGAPAFKLTLRLARVHSVPVNASFEKSGTACNPTTHFILWCGFASTSIIGAEKKI